MKNFFEAGLGALEEYMHKQASKKFILVRSKGAAMGTWLLLFMLFSDGI